MPPKPPVSGVMLGKLVNILVSSYGYIPSGIGTQLDEFCKEFEERMRIRELLK